MLFLLFFLVSFAISPIFAGDKLPNLSGHYGFDWLVPTTTACDAIGEKIMSGFKSCKYFGPGATASFSGKTDFYKCAVSDKSEYMVYKTKERCREELETMQANGP